MPDIDQYNYYLPHTPRPGAEDHGRWLCIAFTDANPQEKEFEKRFEVGFYATEDPNNPSVEGTVYEFREGGFWTDECCVRDKTYIFPHARIAYDVEIGGTLADRVFAVPGTTCQSWLKEAITVLGKYNFFVEGDLVLGDLEMDRRKVEQRFGIKGG